MTQNLFATGNQNQLLNLDLKVLHIVMTNNNAKYFSNHEVTTGMLLQALF